MSVSLLPTALVFALVLSGAARAHAAPTPAWVIGPGQERTVVSMLGGDEGLAGCIYEDVAVERTRIRATFLCAPASNAVSVRLDRREGNCSGRCTEKFRIALEDVRAAPSRFADALQASVERGEGAFVWARPHMDQRRDRTPLDLRAIGANGIVVLALIVVAARIVLRRRREG